MKNLLVFSLVFFATTLVAQNEVRVKQNSTKESTMEMSKYLPCLEKGEDCDREKVTSYIYEIIKMGNVTPAAIARIGDVRQDYNLEIAYNFVTQVGLDNIKGEDFYMDLFPRERKAMTRGGAKVLYKFVGNKQYVVTRDRAEWLYECIAVDERGNPITPDRVRNDNESASGQSKDQMGGGKTSGSDGSSVGRPATGGPLNGGSTVWKTRVAVDIW